MRFLEGNLVRGASGGKDKKRKRKTKKELFAFDHEEDKLGR